MFRYPLTWGFFTGIGYMKSFPRLHVFAVINNVKYVHDIFSYFGKICVTQNMQYKSKFVLLLLILGVCFRRFSHSCETLLLVSSCLSVNPSFHVEKLGSHLTDFHEIWYLKSLKKITLENSRLIKIRSRIIGNLREELSVPSCVLSATRLSSLQV